MTKEVYESMTLRTISPRLHTKVTGITKRGFWYKYGDILTALWIALIVSSFLIGTKILIKQ